MASNFFDKIKNSLDTSITTVSAKSKETVEIAKLKSQIKELNLSAREELGNLGIMVYTMFQEDAFSRPIIDDQCRVVKSIDQAIESKEKEIVTIQIRTQSTIEATKMEFICPTCNMSIPKDSKFCTKCRTKIDGSGVKCKCGHVLNVGAKFCVGCGQKAEVQTPSNLVCSQCSNPVELDTVFCSYCGVKVSDK